MEDRSRQKTRRKKKEVKEINKGGGENKGKKKKS